MVLKYFMQFQQFFSFDFNKYFYKFFINSNSATTQPSKAANNEKNQDFNDLKKKNQDIENNDELNKKIKESPNNNKDEDIKLSKDL